MVTLEAALAAAATLVALAMACSLADRWLARRRPHEAAWTLSLSLFAVASGALWWGASTGWDGPTFRVFFLFGAIVNVPWLAVGSVLLLAPPAVGRRVAAGVALWSAFAAGVLVASPFTGPLPAEGLPKGSEVFGVLPRLLAGLSSGVAAVVVIALALLSVVRLLRGQARSRHAAAVPRPGRLVAGNLLIVAGTFTLAASGSLNARLGEMTAFAVTLVVGVCLLFAGFLVATSATAPRPAPERRGGEAAPPADRPTSAQGAPEELAAQVLR